jgi:hypothetical protein
VGITLLLISAAVAVNLRETEHASDTLHLQAQGLLRLSARVKASEVDLSNLLREAVYPALREVGAEADRYPSDELRENAIDNLALEQFKSLTAWLPLLEGEVKTVCEPISVRIEPAENGFVRARCEVDALLLAKDTQVKIARPLEEIQAFVDCRYFLLQERMNEFLRRLDDIHDRWRNLEYLNAWGKALTGKVELSKQETVALFEMAWCRQELETFGSFCPPSLPIQLPATAPPTLQPAVEAVKRAMTELKSDTPPRERVRAAKSGLEEAESALSGLENLLPQLKSALCRLENRLERIENSTENEANQLLDELLEEGSDEEVESWRLGESGLERVRVRVPRLENPTFPSLLRFLSGASEELSLLGPTPADALPPPSMGPPGLSVLREMKVSKVSFCREDPCGKLGRAATPIYLWFLGVTVWWGQYTITLELENQPIEKILDYENPTIPLNLPLPAHYSLSYTYRIPRQKFRTRVVILLPRHFEIAEST